MTVMETSLWHEANQRYLSDALGEIRHALERHAGTDASLESEQVPFPLPDVPGGSALETLCRSFQLSAFECAVILLCAGIELDARFADLCGAAHHDPHRTAPTFSLTLAAFPDAHWSSLAPSAPLRHWRLIELKDASSPTMSPLHIDERILHFLTGIQYLDDRLSGLIQPESVDTLLLPPSHRDVVEKARQQWAGIQAPLPLLQFTGTRSSDKGEIASALCAGLGMALARIDGAVLPETPHEFELLLRLWEREAILTGSALILEADANLGVFDSNRARRIDAFIDGLKTPLIVFTDQPRHVYTRASANFAVDKPTVDEQRRMWSDHLGSLAGSLNGHLDGLTAHFNLNGRSIQSACHQVQRAGFDLGGDLSDQLWDVCRRVARPGMDRLARRITPMATWEDLVLPGPQLRALHQIAQHVRHRMKVFDEWGFGDRTSRGLGISALFTGQSGTGKTMAAEILAGNLKLDLYRIDLSQVVSKYIGETEKNLSQVFDAAEEGGAILFFDEADALFGKRTEIKDSHDRYANIEVSYLLQRMEAYRGLAILATNLKGALDDAFQRRLRFIISFPFPDAALREQIWQRIFPTRMPRTDLDPARLARLSLTGGSIHNIALNAAFFAAADGASVSMSHLLQAARQEYAKLEKPLSEADIRGWI